MRKRVREWWRSRRRQPGLNTAADAERFMTDLKQVQGVLAEPEPVEVPMVPVREYLEMATPIYDEVWQEMMARLTAERVEVIFTEMVADWRCVNCAAGVHQDCPGCTCPCGVAEPVDA